jgi:initiation factor 1A
VYGKAIKMLGQGRVRVMCGDSVIRTCLICGKMRNRVYVRPQDVVLVALRAGMTDDTKADIVHKYTPEEARALKRHGEIPEKFLGEMSEDGTVGASSGAAGATDATATGTGTEAPVEEAEGFEFDAADIDDL